MRRSSRNWRETRSTRERSASSSPSRLPRSSSALASFGWTVYRDLKKDRDAAKADRGETEARLALLLREDESFAAGRAPPGMTTEQQSLILTAVAAEIVAAGPP